MTGETNKRHGTPIIIAVLFILPRVVRLLSPQVWIEDPYYLYSAYLLQSGAVPFIDFVQRQTPGAEYLLAAIFSLFSPRIITSEIATQILTLIIAGLIYLTGKRIAGARAGVFAGLMFSYSSMVFRYHVWTREMLLLLILTLICLYLFSREKDSARSGVILGLLFACGVLVKITFVIPMTAAVGYLIFFRKQIRTAFVSLAAFAVSSLGFIAVFAALSPEQWLDQLYYSHIIMRGLPDTSRLNLMLAPLRYFDITLVFGMLGVFYWRRRMFPRLWLPIMFGIAEWVYLGAVSTTGWPHNYLPVLLMLALSGGIFWDGWMAERRVVRKITVMIIALFASCVLLLTVVPLVNVHWARMPFGFGYILRKDIDAAAEFIRENTGTSDLLLIPQYLALESGRMLILNDFLEGAGSYAWLRHERERGKGTDEIVVISRRKTFGQIRIEMTPYYWDRIAALIRQKKIKYIIPDIIGSEILPFDPGFIRESGYSLIQTFGPYRVYALRDRPSNPAP